MLHRYIHPSSIQGPLRSTVLQTFQAQRWGGRNLHAPSARNESQDNTNLVWWFFPTPLTKNAKVKIGWKSSPSFGGWKYKYIYIYLKPPPRNDLQDAIRGCWKWSMTEATPKNEFSNWSFRATTSRRVVIPKVYKTRKINSWNLKNHPIKSQ